MFDRVLPRLFSLDWLSVDDEIGPIAIDLQSVDGRLFGEIVPRRLVERYRQTTRAPLSWLCAIPVLGIQTSLFFLPLLFLVVLVAADDDCNKRLTLLDFALSTMAR